VPAARAIGGGGSSRGAGAGVASRTGAAGLAAGAGAAAPAEGAVLRNEPQCLHLMASSWMSSAQKGHFFIAAPFYPARYMR